MLLNKNWKRWFWGITTLLLLFFVAVYIYIFNLEYEDSATLTPDYSIDAISFIHQFEANEKASNTKYSEKIIQISGRIDALETADTTVNVKFVNNTTGSYLICTFQKPKNENLKTLQVGDSVVIKGSCSGGVFSNIMETEAVFLIRSVLEKKLNP